MYSCSFKETKFWKGILQKLYSMNIVLFIEFYSKIVTFGCIDKMPLKHTGYIFYMYICVVSL